MSAVRDRSILIACIGAGAAIVASVAKPVCDSLFPSSRPPQAAIVVTTSGDPATVGHSPVTPTPTTADADAIVGAWKQYVLSPQEGAVHIATFVVVRSKGEYIISPRTQNEGEQFQNSISVFDVAYDGNVWTYNSNWGGGEIGNFELKRVSPTVFEGEIRVAGKLSNRTRLVKIE